MGLEAGRDVFLATPQIVPDDEQGGVLRREGCLGRHVFKQEGDPARLRNALGGEGVRINPLREVHEARKKVVVAEGFDGEGEVGVVDEGVVKPRKALETREFDKTHGGGLEDFVGRFGGEHEAPSFGLVVEGRTFEALEDAELYLLHARRSEPFKPSCKLVERLAGQSGDEIGVDVDVGVCAEFVEIVEEAFGVELARDILGDMRCERLDAELDLDGAGGELGHGVEQGVGDFVRHHLEVERHAVTVWGKELEDFEGSLERGVERAIEEFE